MAPCSVIVDLYTPLPYSFLFFSKGAPGTGLTISEESGVVGSIQILFTGPVEVIDVMLSVMGASKVILSAMNDQMQVIFMSMVSHFLLCIAFSE